MNPHYLEGFVKRAEEHGLTTGQAIDLCKQAFNMDIGSIDPRLLAGLAGGGLGAVGGYALSDDKNKGRNAMLGALAGAGLGAGGAHLMGWGQTAGNSGMENPQDVAKRLMSLENPTDEAPAFEPSYAKSYSDVSPDVTDFNLTPPYARQPEVDQTPEATPASVQGIPVSEPTAEAKTPYNFKIPEQRPPSVVPPVNPEQVRPASIPAQAVSTPAANKPAAPARDPSAPVGDKAQEATLYDKLFGEIDTRNKIEANARAYQQRQREYDKNPSGYKFTV